MSLDLGRTQGEAGVLPAKRTVELGLIALSNTIVFSLFILMRLGFRGHLSNTLWVLLAAFALLSLVGHFSIRRYAPNASQILLPLATLLNGIGFVEIARWNPPYARDQAIYASIGLTAMVLSLKFVKRIRNLDRYRYISLLTAVGLMVLPLVPGIGYSSGGARLWIHLGSRTFQPVEIAKILLAVFFSSYFASNKEMLTARTKQLGRRAVVDPKILLPVLVTFLFALAILGAENDLGFAMLLFALFLSLLWITTGRVAYVVGGVGLLAVGGFVMSKFFYQIHQRISVWLNPWTTHAYSHGGQQILGGWFSMASGGLTGTGLGLGQGGRWVGQWTSDMIFTAIGEELGLLGIIVVLSAIIMIVAEGFRIAQRSHSDFARLAATSLSVIIGFQTFFIAAGVLRLLPLTGITLPFVAFGGSSLISNYVIIGMLLRMSHEAETESHGGFVRQLETA